MRFQHAIKHFAIVDLDDVLPARDAERFERVGGEHAELGVGGDARGADRVGVELGELAEAPRPGFSFRHTGPT